jgi:hypothetical protein
MKKAEKYRLRDILYGLKPTDYMGRDPDKQEKLYKEGIEIIEKDIFKYKPLEAQSHKGEKV